jgi:hypothetical protein
LRVFVLGLAMGHDSATVTTLKSGPVEDGGKRVRITTGATMRRKRRRRMVMTVAAAEGHHYVPLKEPRKVTASEAGKGPL